MSSRKRAQTRQRRLRAALVEQPDGSVIVQKIASHSGNQGCADDRLVAAVQHDQLADAELEQAVLHARLVHGYTWDQVAEHLGISRQAVQKRYLVAEQLSVGVQR